MFPIHCFLFLFSTLDVYAAFSTNFPWWPRNIFFTIKHLDNTSKTIFTIDSIWAIIIDIICDLTWYLFSVTEEIHVNLSFYYHQTLALLHHTPKYLKLKIRSSKKEYIALLEYGTETHTIQRHGKISLLYCSMQWGKYQCWNLIF